LKPALEKFGISNDSRIILYFGKDWFRRQRGLISRLTYLASAASRLSSTAECRHVVAARGKLSKKFRRRNRERSNSTEISAAVARADWLKSNLGKDDVKIIDSRNTEFYDGSSAGNMPRAGHIKSAKNIPFTFFTDTSLKFKDDATIRKMFTDAGVKTLRYGRHLTVISANRELSIILRRRNMATRLLCNDGSFEEWSALKDAPVEKPDRPPGTKRVFSLVTPMWVAENAGAPNVRILDVRQNVYDYFAGHIPNAVHTGRFLDAFSFEGYPRRNIRKRLSSVSSFPVRELRKRIGSCSILTATACSGRQ
jgi:3-mercaptopyruvate sulfurtransferase SseA